jgi:hypothetical protein
MLSQALSSQRRRRFVNCSPAVRSSTAGYGGIVFYDSTLRWLKPAMRVDDPGGSDTSNPPQSPPTDAIAFDDPGGSDTSNPPQSPPTKAMSIAAPAVSDPSNPPQSPPTNKQ